MKMCSSDQQAAYIEDGLWQRALLALLVDRRQVGCGGIRDGGADVKSHDEVAMAEVGREAGGEGLLVGNRNLSVRAPGVWRLGNADPFPSSLYTPLPSFLLLNVILPHLAC